MKKTVIYRGSLSFPRTYRGTYGQSDNFIKMMIDNLRKWFDGEVIVSTWKGQEKLLIGIDGIDKVILSDDPGPGPVQHIKRQVVSYINGLEASTGDMILVSRSDISFLSDVFHFLDTPLTQNDNSMKIFDNRMIIGNMMSINPDSMEWPKYFRLGDWIQLGYKDDISKWANILEYINENLNGLNCTEIIWSISVIKKYLYPDMDYFHHENYYNQYWDYILNNYRILNSVSTLNTLNHNWLVQPEFLDCYLTEDMFNEKYIQKYGKLL